MIREPAARAGGRRDPQSQSGGERAERQLSSQMVGPRDVISHKSHAEITQYEKRNCCHILKMRFRILSYHRRMTAAIFNSMSFQAEITFWAV